MSEPTLWRRCDGTHAADFWCEELGCWLGPVAAGTVLIEQSEHAAFCQMVEDTLSNFFHNPMRVGEAAAAVLNAAVRRYGTAAGEGTT